MELLLHVALRGEVERGGEERVGVLDPFCQPVSRHGAGQRPDNTGRPGRGGRWLGGIDRQIRAHCLSPFISQKMGTLIASENAEDLEVLTQMIDAGDIIVHVFRPEVREFYNIEEMWQAPDLQDETVH